MIGQLAKFVACEGFKANHFKLLNEFLRWHAVNANPRKLTMPTGV